MSIGGAAKKGTVGRLTVYTPPGNLGSVDFFMVTAARKKEKKDVCRKTKENLSWNRMPVQKKKPSGACDSSMGRCIFRKVPWKVPRVRKTTVARKARPRVILSLTSELEAVDFFARGTTHG